MGRHLKGKHRTSSFFRRPRVRRTLGHDEDEDDEEATSDAVLEYSVTLPAIPEAGGKWKVNQGSTFCIDRFNHDLNRKRVVVLTGTHVCVYSPDVTSSDESAEAAPASTSVLDAQIVCSDEDEVLKQHIRQLFDIQALGVYREYPHADHSVYPGGYKEFELVCPPSKTFNTRAICTRVCQLQDTNGEARIRSIVFSATRITVVFT